MPDERRHRARLEARRLEPVIAYLGLGSNLGQRDRNLAEAVSRLGGELAGRNHGRRATGRGVELLRASSVYETAPWGYTCQPTFLNCVLEIRTDLSPGRLLESVKRLEVAMGRQQSFRNGPRLIDVDILLYGESAVELPGLQIPHPRLHQRAFALTPLAELAPRVVHASLGVTIAKLADEADGREGVKLWGPPLSMSIQAV